MARQARRKSETGIYHVVLRGIDRKTLFEDGEDYDRFMELLQKYKEVGGYRLFAYCLMSNHVHLLIKTEKEDIALSMKRIAGSYAYWYNVKYRRSGYLYQDRYKSEAVEDEEYLLAVLRYIHQNPVAAGLCKSMSEYQYSSYASYASEKSGLIDIDYIYSIIDRESLIVFFDESPDGRFMDIDTGSKRIDDTEAMEIIRRVSNCDDPAGFRALAREQRDDNIKKLKDSGLSIRQISRLTGVSFGAVRKA